MNKLKGIWTIAKKEFHRFFHDKRILLSLFLPGLLIYVIYSFLGEGVLGNMTGVEEDYTYTMYAVNAPDELEMEFALLQTQNVSIEKISFSFSDGIT
jgi:sodium transport system permease protein